MEINNIKAPQMVGVELKKQPEKIKETGLKEDIFEKKYDVDTVMKGISAIKLSDGTQKYRYPHIVDEIKDILEKEPQKCEYAVKLAPQENVTQMGLKNILENPVDNLKLMSEIFTTKDKNGKLKFPSTQVSNMTMYSSPADLLKIKALSNSALAADNIIKAAKEKDLDIPKVATKANEMAEIIGDKDLKEVIFARDAFNKGDYTIVGKKNNDDTIKEILDNKLDRYALETLEGYKSDSGKEYKIKKVNDYRNNTVAKTRFEINSKTGPTATHEVRIIKDKNGKVQHTEYMQPSDVKGVFDIKKVYPNGKTEQISSGKVDSKTGITTIKKSMTSTLGTKTEYLFEDDPQGNRISDYKITDKNGKVLLNNSESFEVINENKFISSKNNQKYEITSDKKGVTVKDLNNPERIATFQNDIDIVGEKQEIINVLKQMPGEELFKLRENTTKLVGISDILRSYSRTSTAVREINTGNNLFVILHELGHAVDVKDVDMCNEKETIQNAIFEDDKFNEIYAKEKDAFNKAFPDAQRNHISYFINHETHYNGEIGGRKETIAESNALLTTAKTHEVLGIRSQYLQQYFPETIAYLDGKLGEPAANPNRTYKHEVPDWQGH